MRNIYEYILALNLSCLVLLIMHLVYRYRYHYHTYSNYYGAVATIYAAFYIARVVRLFRTIKTNLSDIKRKHQIKALCKYILTFIYHIEISVFCFTHKVFGDLYSVAIPMGIALLLPFIIY